MKFKELIHLPQAADLGEFGKSEFKNGVADIRRALLRRVGSANPRRRSVGTCLTTSARSGRRKTRCCLAMKARIALDPQPRRARPGT